MEKVINNDIFYIGVNDHQLELFEGQFKVPSGMAYNSYLIKDNKIAIIDTVDINFKEEWLTNIENVLDGSLPDYLIIQHMEPDHSANIINFINKYPNTSIVGNSKTFKMIEQFFHKNDFNKVIVNDGNILTLGHHELKFIFTPMVHWPEVMMSYDLYSKSIFTADAFGKFGALDVNEDWIDEARRYYFGIVGKYGLQVLNTLKKLSSYEINTIYPLHGPILNDNLSYYLNLYDIWSSYKPEEKGIVIVYSSVYGNTKCAVNILVNILKDKTSQDIIVYNAVLDDKSKIISDSFKYDKLILATTTYNNSIFPNMRDFILSLTERNFSNRKVGFIENGSWAPLAIKAMKELLVNSKNLEYFTNEVSILSSLDDKSFNELSKLADEIINM